MRLPAIALAALAVLTTLSASADDKPLNKATLKSAGLASLRPITAREGLKIRGEGGSASTAGLSFVSGMLIDPKTNSYVFGVDTNHAYTCLDVACIIDAIDPYHSLESRIALGMTIDDYFVGAITGGAFGTATALVR